MRLAACVLVCTALGLALALAGCPRGGGDPPATTSSPCSAVADCNGGATCGLLTACVGGYCEGEPSLEIPCR